MRGQYEEYKHQLKFPDNQLDYLKVLNIQSLKQKLNSQAQINQIWENFFTIRILKAKYIYAKCSYCSAKMKYIKDGQYFRLVLFQTIHHHNIKQNNVKFIMMYLKTIPKNIEMTSLKTHLINKFNISSSKCYYILNKFKKQNFPFSKAELINYFASNSISYEIGKDDSNDLPECIFFMTKQMLETYNKFGYCVKLDFTFNLCSDKINFQGVLTNYTIGIISGVNAQNKVVVFSLCICAGQKKIFVKRFLKWFFGLASSCDTIITDNGTSIRAAIDQLRSENQFQTLHCLDIFHFYRTIQIKGQQKWEIIKRLASTVEKDVYQHEFQKLEQMVSTSQINQVLKLRKFQNQLFISQTPANHFLGLSITTASGQKINDLIKHKLNRSLPLFQLAKRLIIICDGINEKSKSNILVQGYQFQNFYPKYKDMIIVRSLVAKKVFSYLLKLIGQSMEYRIDYQGKNSAIITSKFGTVYDLNCDVNRKWSCSCQTESKLFLPCPHILRVCSYLSPQIGGYWKIVQNQGLLIIKRKSNSSRKTRRR